MELQEVKGLLESNRLLTLLGPGGTEKGPQPVQKRYPSRARSENRGTWPLRLEATLSI